MFYVLNKLIYNILYLFIFYCNFNIKLLNFNYYYYMLFIYIYILFIIYYISLFNIIHFIGFIGFYCYDLKSIFIIIYLNVEKTNIPKIDFYRHSKLRDLLFLLSIRVQCNVTEKRTFRVNIFQYLTSINLKL